MKRGRQQGECALIRDRGCDDVVILVACHYRRDGRPVTKTGSSTRFVGLSVIEQE